MPQQEPPGWKKILMLDQDFLPIQRHITMSRGLKFLAWKFHAPIREECRIVIYMDGQFHPRLGRQSEFERIALAVENFEFGLIQTRFPNDPCPSLTEEFDRIVSQRKDTQAHVDASLKWLKSLPDWNNNATLYWNAVFGYDPTNPYYQQASEFFWERYKQELDSWRDQPLWGYTLHHFGIKPLTMRPDEMKSLIPEDKGLKGDLHYHKHKPSSSLFSRTLPPDIEKI